jgi:hypothetical protein
MICRVHNGRGLASKRRAGSRREGGGRFHTPASLRTCPPSSPHPLNTRSMKDRTDQVELGFNLGRSICSNLGARSRRSLESAFRCRQQRTICWPGRRMVCHRASAGDITSANNGHIAVETTD